MKPHRGISLIEVLIGLAIGATLLAAVATAVHASSRAMTTNEQYFKATQGARLAMLNMCTALRASDSCSLGSTRPDLIGEGPLEWPLSTSILLKRGDTGEFITYKLVPATPPEMYNNLLLVRADGKQLMLARNVLDLGFTGQLHKRAYVFCDICNVQMDQVSADAYACPKVPTHTSGPIWDLANVQIQMTVQVGNSAVEMSNSVVPRKVMVVR